MPDHHGQFLLIEIQTKQINDEEIQTCRDFHKIEYNKNLINTHLDSID